MQMRHASRGASDSNGDGSPQPPPNTNDRNGFRVAAASSRARNSSDNVFGSPG